MSSAEPSSTEPIAPPRCYVHADRPAGSVCRRCGRPICPDCMHEAPVGWQCTNCVKEGARISPTIRWRPRPAGRLGNTRITPVVVGLIVANVVVFLWEATNIGRAERRFELSPFYVHYVHQWYRLITSAFLHASFTHLALNMFTLAIIGPAVEAEIGKLRFLALYLLAAVGGSVAFDLLASTGAAAVGASGAIFGVMGAYYVLARLRHWDVQTITVLLVVNLVYSFAVPGIGWQAHVGGLLTGMAVCFGFEALPGTLGAGRFGPAGAGASPSAPPRGAPSGRPSPRPSETVRALQGIAVVIVSIVVLGLLAQVPPGHVNI